jgi:ribonuclease BN (tRNA processing enzyme)
MEITVLGSSGGEVLGSALTGFRIGTDMLLDAGTIGLKMSLAEQRQIRHVLLTHAHLDHVHALPFLLDNLIGRIPEPVLVYGLPEVLETVHTHIFNGKIWPDFSILPLAEQPILKFFPVEPGRVFSINGYSVEAVRMNHSVPSAAYMMTGPSGTVVFTGDTGPTETLWQRLGQVQDLRALFMECSFSGAQQAMAVRTRHLTPADLLPEIRKTGKEPDFPVFLYHLKPEYAEAIATEAAALAPFRVSVAKSGDVINV